MAETVAGRARAARPALIDGAAGAVWAPGGQPRVVIRFTILGVRFVAIDSSLTPSAATGSTSGYEVDLVVMGDNREMHRRLLGWRSFRELRQSGSVRFVGPTSLGRGFPTWFRGALFATSLRPPKPAPATARDLAPTG